ncbi:hypothetical protein Q7511_11080, partial [Glaesserella parasuis]|nr:hypothetical protein [Glaesserella parasuis]
VILSGDKVPYGGTIAATTTDFAGNKQAQPETKDLNKGPTDETANEPEYSKARTDVPTITAGRTEAVNGVSGDQPNAGDIVAKPGGDNDRMVVKYKDEDGNAKEIAVKKDLEQGKWVLDDTTPEDKKPASTDDYIIKDDGTVIVKGPKVKDGSEAEAIGYKTVNGQEKASTEPYTAGQKSDGTWYATESEVPKNGDSQNPLTKEERAVISAHKDDNSPTQTDKPTVSKGDASTLEKGSAKIKPGQDNTEVVVNFQGYARTVTETPNSATGTGQTQPTERKIITTQSTQADNNADPIYAGAQNTFTTTEVEAVLVARKENGEWKLYSSTKADYEHKEQGDDGQQHPSPRNLSPVSDDVATIDKDGNIVLKAQAVQDSTQVSATGFNAMKQPTQGATDTDNITVDPGLTAEEVKNKTVDVPTIEQLNDGSVVAKPGQDNKEMTVTYPNKEGQGQSQTITVEKVAVNGEGVPEGTTKWQLKNGSQLPDGVQLDPTTGAITIPKDKVNVDGKVNAKGKDEQNNEAKAEELTVKADATPESAEAAKVTTEGDKVVSEPGGDSKTQTVNAVDPNGEKTPIVVAEKGEDGKWKLDESDPNKGNANGATVQDNGNTITITKDGNTITLDKDTGKITIDPGVVSDGKSISTETADASGNTTSSGEPVVPPKKETSTDSADKPIITQLNDGENKGGVQIQPGSDNTTFTVRYVKEPETADGNTNTDATTAAQREPDSTLTAVKDKQTGKWSFSETVASDVAEINAEDGTITLKAKAVMDGSKVKAEGQDILGNKQAADEGIAPSNPDVVAPEAQPKPPTVEPEPETPAQPQPPAQPDLRPAPAPQPTDKLDSPTEFKNTGVGTVQIKAGQNVDFISFTVETAEGKQNIAFIKDDAGGWEKYVMKLGGDTNNNDIIDGDETVEYAPVTPTQQLNGTFTVDGITSSHITNILVGKEGDEFLKPVEDTTIADNFDVSGAGHKVHSFAVKQNNNVAVPEKMHVLSNGEELVAPIFQPEIVDGKYRLKVTADPAKIAAINFEFGLPTSGNDYFYVLSNAGKWILRPGETEPSPFFVGSTDEEPNVFYIQDSTTKGQLNINTNASGVDGFNSRPNNKIVDIDYGMRNGGDRNDNTRMDNYYSLTDDENDPWVSDVTQKIELTDITITPESAQTVPSTGSTSPSTPTTGGDSSGTSSGTQTGGGTTAPTTPTPKEEYDTPTATVDNQNKGGVIVSPRSENSGQPKTKHFRVDYQQPDGTNKSIWFKYEGSSWQLDQSKNSQMNGINVDTNGGNGPIKLDTSTGKVTFAPSAVKDGSEVYISALAPDGTTARRQAKVKAEVELQPMKPTAEIDSVNRGGAIVTPKDNTNKFKLT